MLPSGARVSGTELLQFFFLSFFSQRRSFAAKILCSFCLRCSCSPSFGGRDVQPVPWKVGQSLPEIAGEKRRINVLIPAWWHRRPLRAIKLFWKLRVVYFQFLNGWGPLRGEALFSGSVCPVWSWASVSTGTNGSQAQWHDRYPPQSPRQHRFSSP